MRNLRLFAIVATALFLLPLAFAPRVSAQYHVPDLDVNLTCRDITVTVYSNDDDPTETQVLVKTANYVGWNLRGEIDDYLSVGPRGQGTRTFDFPDQPAHMIISYSVRVMDAATNVVVYVEEATRDCSGEATGSGSSNQTVNTNGGAPFTITCTAEGGIYVQPIEGGSALVATPLQIAQGLVDASSTAQNTMVARSGSISIWALTSQEIQVAYRAGLNEFDAIFPVTQCGGINAASLAQVTPSPQVTPVAGTASSTAYSGYPANVTTNASCSVPSGARATHIVQAGENLFRIGLRYGVPYTQLAAYNGISDPTRIFVGQCIVIP
ncbi:MAG: LysM peptidoglycan-binding domain-containing protein [Anaerolineae bacterium]|nr:LysM peptidoglycan-binding domain-containing protein [Anaerolineae bacterium]